MHPQQWKRLSPDAIDEPFGHVAKRARPLAETQPVGLWIARQPDFVKPAFVQQSAQPQEEMMIEEPQTAPPAAAWPPPGSSMPSIPTYCPPCFAHRFCRAGLPCTVPTRQFDYGGGAMML